MGQQTVLARDGIAPIGGTPTNRQVEYGDTVQTPGGDAQ